MTPNDTRTDQILTIEIKTAVTWTEALDSLLEAYSNIAENLPQFKRYKDLFGVSSYTRKILEMIYEDILDFHKWALKFFMLKSMWPLFPMSGFNTNLTFRLEDVVSCVME
jgi:hypothetical protein